MKNILYIIMLVFTITVVSHAATRGDVKVIEASENIRFLSQKLVKDYLFFYKYPQRVEFQNALNHSLFKLTDDFRIIATTTKDTDTKDVLEFLAYSKDQISEIVNESPNEEKAALMLDYSETLLEGADSIAMAHKYDFTEEEMMLIRTKKMEYLLERITKYYFALHAGFDNMTNQEAMADAMKKFEKNIAAINLYKYPAKELKLQNKMNFSWKMNKDFFQKTKELFIPKLMLDSVGYLESIISKIALYHSKNQ